jgi:hypothetical protein
VVRLSCSVSGGASGPSRSSDRFGSKADAESQRLMRPFDLELPSVERDPEAPAAAQEPKPIILR